MAKLPLPGAWRSEAKAIHSPSGDQLHIVSDHGPSVSRRMPPASPSSASMMYRFLFPDLPDRNTTHFPSGDGDGNALFSPPTVSFFIEMVSSSSSPREIATTSTSVLSLAKSGPMLVYITPFLFQSHDVEKAFPEKILRRPPEPSGFTTYIPGSPTNAIFLPSCEKEGNEPSILKSENVSGDPGLLMFSSSSGESPFPLPRHRWYPTRAPSGEMNGLKWCTRGATGLVTSK
ncbi:hypothetical protein EE612_021577 [Oryza sativa]|nr:hypothetical protein EE612_021577 [Oryza sativa]